MTSFSYRLNHLLKNGTVAEVIPLSKYAKYIKGETYWCGYWQQYYTVIDVCYEKHGKYSLLKWVQVKWEDGKETKHCTQLDTNRDYIIRLRERS